MNNKPMLNAYPDSLGGKLSDIAALLKKKEMQDTFSSFYILPSLYHSDLVKFGVTAKVTDLLKENSIKYEIGRAHV